MEEDMTQDEYVKMLEEQNKLVQDLLDYLYFMYNPARNADEYYVKKAYEKTQDRRWPLAKYKFKRDYSSKWIKNG
jgi:hypothetical protein